MRKHHGPAAALAVRVLTAWTYGAAGAGGARACRVTTPAATLATPTIRSSPTAGEGLREAAEEFNRKEMQR